MTPQRKTEPAAAVRPRFKPDLERQLEIWKLSTQGWDIVEQLDRLVGGSPTLAAALEEMHRLQLHAMAPLVELGVFRKFRKDELSVLKAEPQRGSTPGTP